MLWFQPIRYLCFHFPFGVSVDVEILHVYLCSYSLCTCCATSWASYFWRGYSSIAYGWGEDTLCAADWVPAAVAIAYSWTTPPLWALRHSIYVSTSIITILTTSIVSYACIWTHIHFIYCIMFFYFRLHGWLLWFWIMYLFWMI